MDSKGEILLTIMASLAQQESQSLSQNVKLGIQYRYQQGKIHINHNRFLGYTKDKDGNLVIVPEEAEIVKRIYREYLEGSSMLQIARGLEADGILTGAGNHRWHTSTINKILRNEKYIGDALLQKTYTVDFLSKKRVPNNGIVPQYYVENSHEPIIPREIYMQVKEELVRRRCVHISKNGKKRNYSNNHPLSQMVFCGKCHEVFRRVHWNNRGKKSIVWRCVSRLENTGLFCTASTILEDNWNGEITELKKIIPEANSRTSPLHPRFIIETVAKQLGPDALVATDVGQHQMWTAQFYPLNRPRSFLTSGGLGTMGSGMGLAIGAKIANPGRPVALFTGDGSFRMNCAELATAANYHIPLLVVILNNRVLGMVRQWQTLFYDERYAETTLDRPPDFVKLAEAYSAAGFRAHDEASFTESLTQALAEVARGKTAVIDAIIDKDEQVLPMVPGGMPIDEQII